MVLFYYVFFIFDIAKVIKKVTLSKYFKLKDVNSRLHYELILYTIESNIENMYQML